MERGRGVVTPQGYVVVGAAGILAPLGALLRISGGWTVGISRGGRLEEGDWDDRVALDAQDVDAVSDYFAHRMSLSDKVIVYAGAVNPASWAIFVSASHSQVLVVTSSWADPQRDDHLQWSIGDRTTIVQLGWTGPPGSTRWHEPQEVCAVVLRAVHAPSGSRLTLGTVRPWVERPS